MGCGASKSAAANTAEPSATTGPEMKEVVVDKQKMSNPTVRLHKYKGN
jgi:hypothetical protein